MCHNTRGATSHGWPLTSLVKSGSSPNNVGNPRQYCRHLLDLSVRENHGGTRQVGYIRKPQEMPQSMSSWTQVSGWTDVFQDSWSQLWLCVEWVKQDCSPRRLCSHPPRLALWTILSTIHDPQSTILWTILSVVSIQSTRVSCRTTPRSSSQSKRCWRYQQEESLTLWFISQQRVMWRIQLETRWSGERHNKKQGPERGKPNRASVDQEEKAKE